MFKLVKLFCIDHGKMSKESWKIMEKSWNLIPGNRWEPWFYNQDILSPSSLVIDWNNRLAFPLHGHPAPSCKALNKKLITFRWWKIEHNDEITDIIDKCNKYNSYHMSWTSNCSRLGWLWRQGIETFPKKSAFDTHHMLLMWGHITD